MMNLASSKKACCYIVRDADVTIQRNLWVVRNLSVRLASFI